MKIGKVLKAAVLSSAAVAIVSAGAFAALTDCIQTSKAAAEKSRYPGLIMKTVGTKLTSEEAKVWTVKCTSNVKDGANRYNIWGKTQSDCSQAGSIISNSGNCDSAELNVVVNTIINTIIFVIGMISVVMIILGGISYATSQGDPGKVKKGKDTILYGIIGLVISLLAFAIVNFVLNSLG